MTIHQLYDRAGELVAEYEVRSWSHDYTKPLVHNGKHYRQRGFADWGEYQVVVFGEVEV